MTTTTLVLFARPGLATTAFPEAGGSCVVADDVCGAGVTFTAGGCAAAVAVAVAVAAPTDVETCPRGARGLGSGSGLFGTSVNFGGFGASLLGSKAPVAGAGVASLVVEAS